MEERPVLAVVQFGNQHRAANGKAGVIFLIDWNSGVVSAPGVKEIVAEDLEAVSVELVGSRGRLIGEHSPRQPILGGVGGAQDIEFVNLFERRVPDGLKALGFRLSHGYAIEYNLA